MAYVILGYSFVNPAPLPPENVKCKNVNFYSTLGLSENGDLFRPLF